MSTTGTAITGAGVWTPESVVNNEELCAAFNEWVRLENQRNAAAIAAGEVEPLAESSPEFIVKASGIVRRHVQDRVGILDPARMAINIPARPDEEMSIQCEYSVNAAREALAAAGRHGEEIDLIICAVSNLQRAYPAIATEVQDALGTRGSSYDMQVGCSSVTFAVRNATEAVQCGNASRVLIVTPEIMTGHANFRDRDQHFIFGDAAVALVIERADDVAVPGAFEILSTRAFSRYSSNIRNNFGFLDHCDPDHEFGPDKRFYQQGRRVFKDIVPLAAKFITEHLEAHDLQPGDVQRYWLHQANINMNNLIARRVLGSEPDQDLAPVIIDEYGNAASAGSVIAFAKYHDDLPAGAHGVMCSFGAGYSMGSALLRRM